MTTLGRNKNEELQRADDSDKWAVPGAAPIRVPGAHPTSTRTLPTAIAIFFYIFLDIICIGRYKIDWLIDRSIHTHNPRHESHLHSSVVAKTSGQKWVTLGTSLYLYKGQKWGSSTCTRLWWSRLGHLPRSPWRSSKRCGEVPHFNHQRGVRRCPTLDHQRSVGLHFEEAHFWPLWGGAQSAPLSNTSFSHYEAM